MARHMLFSKGVNVPSAQLASVLPNAPGETFQFGAPLPPKSELIPFLSLMTGLLDKNPVVAAEITELAAFSSPSGAN